ncbi:conserved hypothetical protein [Verticillium alfalfae VaMs.102]|uniref:glutathione-specific gamma-glutamylcyclotransferase n=1 Tax=Verticillium alfalfae (strain VaMs.102 / ATCC MYA-4576 / FGSC 10136) TaxID=526221 RepID=C9SMG7_VERA1|nr:conserved hypothetical protein [Verticillium alfalfae VaMs.102]EEY19982.1 conserved hypothetical protein [Verticillium alfalfae VaMs.102]
MASADLYTDGDEFWLFGYGLCSSFLAEAPGRVVTLIERSYWSAIHDAHDSAPDRVWGVAYRIRPDKVAEVRDYLDIREINGYTIHYTPFHPAESAPSSTTSSSSAAASASGPHTPAAPIRTLVYIGTPDNDQFTGPQDPQALAAHIRRSVGPSGLNTDYLFNLDQALDELSPDSGDDHIRDLTRRVRAIIAAEGPSAEAETKAGELARTNATSTEEQEETEH